MSKNQGVCRTICILCRARPRYLLSRHQPPHQPPQALHYFPGDTFFTPLHRPAGLPLGNQTSQFFANVYANPMDHMIVRNLRPAAYARYVDDFLLFSDGKEQLQQMRTQIQLFLYRYCLTLHPRKSRI